MFKTAAALAAFCFVAMPAQADEPAWSKAQQVLSATDADFQRSGVRSVADHVADLEASLAGARQAVADAAKSCIVLTNGGGDALISLLPASKPSTNPNPACQQTQALQDPYGMSALYLGSYYNETGKSEDALRVLDLGLGAISSFNGTRPWLISEKGAALVALKRWQDGLADYDEGLQLTDLEPADHARLLRGRGMCLTELNRLDEAEAAYRESLTFDPGNRIALNELEYIARLKAGGERSPSEMTLPKN